MFQLVRLSFIVILLYAGNIVAESANSPAGNIDLKAMYAALQQDQVSWLQGQPITIHSDIKNSRLIADIYAIAPYVFNDMIKSLSRPEEWCRFITLHLNIKACVYQLQPQQELHFYAGRKFYEDAADAYQLKYQFEIKEKTDDYFKLILSAEEGPFGTSDYIILFELQRVDAEVIMHMSLSYQTSFRSRVGSSVYLSTIGADKVGFSQYQTENGAVEFIDGVEGIIERNAMRYFLALDVYFKNKNTGVSLPEAWFDATEKYARQLHEVEKAEYLKAKDKEYHQQMLLQQELGQK